jgi:sigma-B regulation protein RsbU (phosphoserine phosphatase)
MTTELAAVDAARASGTPGGAAPSEDEATGGPAGTDSPNTAARPGRPPRAGARAPLARALGASSIRYRIALAAAGAVFVACLLMTIVGYLVERQNIIRGIDSRLLAAAAAVPHMLPPGYHERVFDGEQIPETEYRAIVAMLNDYVDTAQLPYLYSYIVRGGEVYVTSANQVPAMRPSGRIFPFLMHETDPPPGVREASGDGKPRFINYTTRFGSFRSIFVPVGESPERRYIIGADVTIDFMRASLLQRLVQASLVAVIVSAAVGAGAAWFAGRLTRPVGRLARAIDTLGADGAGGESRFGRQSGGDLERVAQRTDESGRLASSMLAMQDRLGRYLRQLDTVTRAQQRLATQLDIARRIQEGLLPRTPPPLSKLQVVGWSEAAEHVGGDFYDWIIAPCEDAEAICILADAAGHGVAAALTAATCRAHARDLLRRCRDSLAEGLAELSDVIAADAADGHFITLFAAAVQGERLRIGSAGHGPILICRAGGDRGQAGAIEQVDATGPPLGVIDSPRFAPDHHLALAPGDTLLVASDGVFEAPGPAGDRFGIPRLKSILSGCGERSGEEIVQLLRDEVAAFTGGAAPADDMTVLVIRRPL